MKSYIKIYGPPILKAIKALEKIAIEMPDVSIMDMILSMSEPGWDYVTGMMDYFSGLGEIDIERSKKIVSKSGESLGEYDFYFEWLKEPSQEQLNGLIEKIDAALAPLGCKYTITTK